MTIQPKSTFFGGNKKGDHKLSKAFYFIKISSKYHMFRLNLKNIFANKGNFHSS